MIIIFERFDHSFEIKSIDSAKRLIRGVASLEEVDRDGEIIAMEAFDDSLQQWLTNPVIRFKHTDPIGKGISNACFVDKSTKEFIVTAYISDKTEKAREAWGLIEDGIIKSFSVGGKVLERVGIKSGTGKEVNKITKMELYEVSVVDIPSNRKSFFEVIAKSMKEKESKDDVAQRLYGKPYAELTDSQKEKVNLEVNEEKNINVSKGPECPHCGSPNTESDDKGLYHCLNCGQDFTPGKAAQDINKPCDQPPKEWMDRCMAHVQGKVDDPGAVCAAEYRDSHGKGKEPTLEGVDELVKIVNDYKKSNAPETVGENPSLDKNKQEEKKCQKTTSNQQLEVTLKTTLLNKLQKS